MTKRGKSPNKRNKKVIQLDFYTGEVVGTYNSLNEAAMDNDLEATVLSKALRVSQGEMRGLKLKFAFAD